MNSPKPDWPKFVVTAACALLTLCGTMGIHHAYSHGWNAHWYLVTQSNHSNVPTDKEIHVVATQEARASFPNVHLPLARIIQHWPFHRANLPDRLPRFRAELETEIVVEGDPRRVRVASPNTATLSGLPSTQWLKPGHHAIRVDWKGDFQKPHSQQWEHQPVALKLQWKTKKGPWSDVPFAALSPRQRTGFQPPLSKAAAQTACLAAFFAFLVALFTLLRPAYSPAGTRWRYSVAFLAVLLPLSASLRLHDYDVMPDFRENQDELFATWNGWQLLENGTTRGWSLWPGDYRSSVEATPFSYFQKKPLYIIQPYFEHPPLAHVLAGAAARYGGAKHWSHAKLKHTRLVPIALGILTVALVFLLGLGVTQSHRSARWAAFLAAFFPYLVLQGRTVKEESLVAPLALGSLILLVHHLRRAERPSASPPSRILSHAPWILSAVLAGLCPIAKLPGAAWMAVGPLVLGARRQWKQAWLYGILTSTTAALLLAYAAWQDWDRFWATTELQAVYRAPSWSMLRNALTTLKINHQVIDSSPLLFLWASLFACAARGSFSNTRPSMGDPPFPATPDTLWQPLTIGAVLYVTAMGLSAGTWYYGWYLLPVVPLLCVSGGHLIARVVSRPHFFWTLIILLCLVLPLAQFPVELDFLPTDDRQARNWITGTLILSCLPAALFQAFPNRPFRSLARANTLLALLMWAGLSTYFTVHYDLIYGQIDALTR